MRSAVVLLWVALVSCNPGTPTVITACERACAHMQALCAEGHGSVECENACDASSPDEDGASCVAVCVNAETSGVLHLDPECHARADTCAALSDCD